MLSKSFINLFSLIILNCVGSGLLNLIPSLAKFGINSFPAWIMSAIGYFAVAMSLLRIALSYQVKDYAIQNIIAAPFSDRISEIVRRSIFMNYWVFGVVGNGVLAISLGEGLRYFFPWFVSTYEVTTYFIIFFLFSFLNRFGIDFSRNINVLMSVLKIMIMAIFPCIAFFILPCALKFSDLSLNSQGIFQAMFITIWPFVGIESVLMEREIDKKSIVGATLLGLLCCLGIYCINTYVMMTNIADFSNCTSPYFELFKMVFPQSNLAQIFVNISIIIITSGSLYGWTYIIVTTLMSAENFVPSWIVKKNRYGIPDLVLFGSSFVTWAILAFIKKTFPYTNAFEVVVEVCTALLLAIYAVGIFSFAIFKWQSWKSYIKEYRNQKYLMDNYESKYATLTEEIDLDEDTQEFSIISKESVDLNMDRPNKNELYFASSGTNCPFLSWLWQNMSDLIMFVLATSFVVLAFIGSSFILTLIGLILFSIPIVYYSINL